MNQCMKQTWIPALAPQLQPDCSRAILHVSICAHLQHQPVLASIYNPSSVVLRLRSSIATSQHNLPRTRQVWRQWVPGSINNKRTPQSTSSHCDWVDGGTDGSFRVRINDAGVNTTDFIQASESLVKLFDLLGSSAFAIVQKDMTGNIEKIRTRQNAFPAQCETLEGLVKGEAVEKKRTATEGLMWLLRYYSRADIWW